MQEPFYCLQWADTFGTRAAREAVGAATDTGADSGGTGQGEGWDCIHDEGPSTVIWSILD